MNIARLKTKVTDHLKILKTIGSSWNLFGSCTFQNACLEAYQAQKDLNVNK